MTLQEQALKIIDKYNLINQIGSYGETHLVGNVALNTTVKPDIDIQVYLDKSKWTKTVALVIQNFSNLGLTDFIRRDLAQSHKYLLSFAVYEFDKRWTIDITFTEKGELPYLQDAYRFYLDYKDKLNNENTAIIREIKQHFLNEGKLKDSMAFYIYTAVLEHGVKNVNEMNDYLEKL